MTTQEIIYQRGDRCPECGSGNLIHDHEVAEIACMECGFVIEEDFLDRSHPERRSFNHEEWEKRTRTGMPLLHRTYDKGTIIGPENRDSYGHLIPSQRRPQIYRLRKWNERSKIQTGFKRNLSIAFPKISKISNKLSLPKNVLETASVIYEKAVKKGVIKGRSIDGLTAAAIYAACRQCELPRTLDEIAQVSDLNKKTIARDYRTLIKRLDYYENIQPPTNNQYIAKISNHFGINGKTEEIAYKIFKTAEENKFTAGKSPPGMAAATFYISSVLTGEKKTQREIAEFLQITEVTIRNRYKEMMKKLDFIISL